MNEILFGSIIIKNKGIKVNIEFNCDECFHYFVCGNCYSRTCNNFIPRDYIKKLESLLDEADKDQYFGISGWRNKIKNANKE